MFSKLRTFIGAKVPTTTEVKATSLVMAITNRVAATRAADCGAANSTAVAAKKTADAVKAARLKSLLQRIRGA